MLSQAEKVKESHHVQACEKVNHGELAEIDSSKKVLIVGYSPTGGGHTARTLNIVQKAISQNTLKEGDSVILYVPPRWEGNQRPEQLIKLSEELTKKSISVKLVESEKPVYGYLDKATGGSDDARILERIALSPLRNEKMDFLKQYFEEKLLQPSVSDITDYNSEIKINELPRMSANTLIDELVGNYGVENVYVLSDMDPALQKAANNNGVIGTHRLDQQNHAILLDINAPHLNIEMRKAVLAKVLGGRGEQISHISLGGKNTLNTAVKILDELGIKEEDTIHEAKNKIHQVIIDSALDVKDIEAKFDKGIYSGVIKGNEVKNIDDIDKVIYIYAHMKTPIIARHVLNKIKNNDSDYNKKVFVFCGAKATGDHNAMHLAYLADADGITTSGAGTSGEFVYLHKCAGAKSNLLSLPIEGHNEQEAITDALFQHLSTREHILRPDSGERLEQGAKIDELVRKKVRTETDHVVTYKRFITALKNNVTYVDQAHDILFRHEQLDREAFDYQNIQQDMYKNSNLKGARHYLKLVFQLLNYLTSQSDPFPVTTKFKESSQGEKFSSMEEIRNLFNNPKLMEETLHLTDEKSVESLPLINDVRRLIKLDNLNSEEGRQGFIKLKDKFGHYMTTGF
ncbi:hypothetical protein CJP72_18990 [Citrobacter sp. NCU1]|uniref:hypothetical protein n=1 Tax=Citrobacter sp. NCU1 TaxID=2026683 RepID=UPI0013908F3B|nr:hypothetical protein [Citrobacter sp. NCU1]NDO82781.1 hypothetical protein [Citrobacter sp. NCU1]